MPVKQQDRILLTCPRCGHQQREPRAVISTVCRECHQHFLASEVARPTATPSNAAKELRRIVCFECGTELSVATTAQSTMCKRCSAHIDLRDYLINRAVSQNFRTKGQFVIDAKGYVFNTEASVGEAVIKGRFLGKLVAERSLTVYSTAEIKGTFQTGRLVVPAGNHFRWKENLRIGSAEISGELVANIESTGMVLLKSTARFFGDINAGSLVVEEGAVVVGSLRVGPS